MIAAMITARIYYASPVVLRTESILYARCVASASPWDCSR